MSDILVNWDGKQFIGRPPQHLNTPEKVLATARVDKRPREIKDLIVALDTFWEAVGVHAVCKACFVEGRLGYDGKTRFCEYPDKINRGCCGQCIHLSDKGCIGKPLGCAVYYCGITLPKQRRACVQRVSRKVFSLVYGWDNNPRVLDYTVYADGYYKEQAVKLDNYGRTQVRRATLYVMAATRRLERGNSESRPSKTT